MQVRRFLGALAGLLIFGSAACQGARYVSVDSRVLHGLTLVAPFAVIGFLLAAVIVVALIPRSQSRSLVALVAVGALVGAGVSAWALAPDFTGGDRGRNPDVSVMLVDMNAGDADINDVLRWAVSDKVEVLALTRVDDLQLEALDRAEARTFFPHAETGIEGVTRTAVFSTRKLSDPSGVNLSQPGMSVQVAGPDGQEGRGAFTLVAAGLADPLVDRAAWKRDVDSLSGVIAEAGGAPLVMALNAQATADDQRFRGLLDLGLRDAAEQANSGWQPTWPHSTGERIPRFPFAATDHVLTSRQFAAASTLTRTIGETSHLALVARLQQR